ncbi:hypothetical protein D3C76_739130 [compost metagenome]|uniref:Uncharacterized protein n=1 Tax=Pseudomonas jinjuensis TaxID=198616 RepID=A0A1H0NZS5_9PSED|nr:hypothetical protein [Pseudomonas jinjuensis]SDO98153.1 hypothetical protein SAMN05216193_11948 [Pseudomonas jinjuensis]
MKLEITRGLLLAGALGIASLAAAALQEPSLSVIQTRDGKASQAAGQEQTRQEVRPDRNLLLLMFGLSQGAGAQWR